MGKLVKLCLAIAMCGLFIGAFLVALFAVMEAVEGSPVALWRLLLCVPMVLASWGLHRVLDS